MLYCTALEVRAMVKEDALSALIGDAYIESAEEKEQYVTPIIEAAILDAEGLIDGYLAKRYPTPLVQCPKVINGFCKDIAVYNLFSRIGINEDNKNYLTRYEAAIKFFEFAAIGKIDIGISSGQVSADTGFQLSSNHRLFSRGSMGGM